MKKANRSDQTDGRENATEKSAEQTRFVTPMCDRPMFAAAVRRQRSDEEPAIGFHFYIGRVDILTHVTMKGTSTGTALGSARGRFRSQSVRFTHVARFRLPGARRVNGTRAIRHMKN